MRRGAAPLPASLVHGGLGVLAFSTVSPAVLAGCLLGSIALLVASTGPRRLFVTVAVVSGLLVAALNPFVASEGDLILLNGPSFPVLDLQVTLEELGYGLTMGLRIAATTLLAGAFLGIVDRDRLAAAVARVAPRSALTVALAARMLPALRRDSQSIVEAARLRGIGGGGRRERLAGYGGLLEPLAASALERGMDHAEAMAARGYGQGRRTALPESRMRPGEVAAAGAGLFAAALAIAAIAGAATFRWYPTMAALSAGGWLIGAAAALVGAVSALLFRGMR